MRHLALFNGIGGFQLAAAWCGWENVAHVEIDDFCNKVVAKHFPESVCHTDIKQFDGTPYRGRIDVISGGFPCQRFSTASHGKSIAEDNWPDMFRVCKEIKSDIVVSENVSRSAIIRAAQQLESIGYVARIDCKRAERYGAWHRRNRWFVTAYSNDKSKFQGKIYAKMALLPSMENRVWKWPDTAGAVRVFDGVSNRVDRFKRIKALGNSVMPEMAYEIFKAIPL